MMTTKQARREILRRMRELREHPDAIKFGGGLCVLLHEATSDTILAGKAMGVALDAKAEIKGLLNLFYPPYPTNAFLFWWKFTPEGELARDIALDLICEMEKEL